MIETRENADWEPVWTKMTKIPGTADYDGWEMDEVVVTAKRKPKTKDQKVNSTLEYLKDGKEVRQEDLEMMKEVLSDKEALKLLEKKLEENESKILSTLSEDQMKKVYQNLPQQERQNFEKLFNKISVDREQKAKKAELQRAIKDKKIELAKLEGGIRSGSTYKVENFRSKAESKKEVKLSVTENVSSAISDQEMENLNKILWGKFLVEEKLNKVEKKLKSDFKKAIVMLKENSNASMMEVIQAFNKGNMSKAEVEKSFARKDKKEWKEKEIDKLQKGYLAYLEAKKGNSDTSRWNAVIGTLETGLLNLGQSLDKIIVENVSMPISKKERKAGEKEFKKEFFEADTGEFKDLKNNYLKEHAQEIQELKQYSGYSNEEIKEYINKKAYKQYLKEQEKFWIQKSDLGKFRVLINALEGKSVEDKITALLTDTNFDGMRNRLDGRGTKRGNQIDQALIMAQRNGKTMDNISANIINYLNSKGENIELKAPFADSFAKWLSADIKNAIKVQSALMDSPVGAVDIMSYGSGALKKTLEAQRLTPEELKQIEDKINTDPATRELSQQARDTLMANLSSYLLSKMREPGVNANVNGLGVGVNIPLNQILKGLSFSLGTGATMEGKSFAGVSVAWNTEVVKWKDGGVSVGLNAGTTLGLIPIYGFRAGIEQDVNAKKVLGSVDPTSLKTFSAGVNLTMIGKIPSYGASIGFEKNQIKGIEKQYAHIKKEITPLIKKLLIKEGDKYPDIAQTLQSLFKNSSKEEIQKATENLTSILKMVQDQGLDAEQASQFIGERYAESWRDNAIQGLPKGWKFTGASLGVQFLAGFFPVATLSATLTKYKNLSHSDSPESRARLQQSIERGRGDVMKKSVSEDDFVNIKNQLEAINVLNSNDKLNMNNNWELVFSHSLLNKTGLNVKINENLKGYIKSENGNLIIPAGVSYRFLTSARTNDSFSELDIGYEQWSKNLQSLRAGNLESFVGEKDYGLDQHIEGLKTLLESFNLADVKIEDWKLFQKGAEIWDLTKDSGLAIDKDWNIKITEEKGKITKKSQPSLTVDDKLNKQVEDLFNEKIIDSLTKLTKQKDPFTHFRGFLEHAKAMKEEYVKAAEELIKMISWDEYNGIKTAIKLVEKDGNQGFENPKLAIQVMDRLKAIFATISPEQKSSRNAVVNLAKQRNQEYTKNHKGLSVLEDFSGGKLNIDYVKLAEGLPEKPTPALKKNLIGFTAFYKRKAGEARGMSMTAYGQTNVLGDIFPVEDAYKETAKDWLLKNLDKQKEQLKSIAKSIGTFPNATEGVDKNGNLSLDSITELLKWKSVDLWGKKITLNTRIVKYFLAECANESIGIRIDRITIEDSQQVEQQPTKMTFNASETIAQANIKKSDFSIGVAFGGGRKEEKNQDSGYGGYTEQEGGTGKGEGSSGKPLESNEWSTQQNSNTQTGAWTGGDESANGGWGR